MSNSAELSVCVISSASAITDAPDPAFSARDAVAEVGNTAFSIVAEKLFPFTTVSPTTFRLKISLVSSRFKIESSAVESSCAQSAVKSKKNKPANPEFFAMAEFAKLNEKKPVFQAFKSEVKGTGPEAAITVSADATVSDTVHWGAGTCVATFDREFQQEVLRSESPDGGEAHNSRREGLKWHPFAMEFKLTQAQKAKDGQYVKQKKGVLGSVQVNVADYISTGQPTECVREEEVPGFPDGKFYLRLKIEAYPLNRLYGGGGGDSCLGGGGPAGAAAVSCSGVAGNDCGGGRGGGGGGGDGEISSQEAFSIFRAPTQDEKSAKSQLGFAENGRELLVKVAPDCNFKIGIRIGIAIEECWRGKRFMLLHKLSKFEECEEHSVNFFGTVTGFSRFCDYASMRVKPKRDCVWRLLSCCSASSKRSIPSKQNVFSLADAGDAALQQDDAHFNADGSMSKCTCEGQKQELICCILKKSPLETKCGSIYDYAVKCYDQRLDKQMQAQQKAKKQTEQYQKFQSFKQLACSTSAGPFKLTSDEIGMVKLRQGFFISQPLISDFIRRIVTVWFPGKEDDTCIRYFRSKDGPWDIFNVINFLLLVSEYKDKEGNTKTENIFKRLNLFLFGNDADDREDELRTVLNGILVVRNWWAHIGVPIAECTLALQRIEQFIRMVQVRESTNCDAATNFDRQAKKVLNALTYVIDSDDSLNLCLDDIAYIFFLRASHKLCRFCDYLREKFPNNDFSTKLKFQLDEKSKAYFHRPQSDVTELREIRKALKSMGCCAELHFDCELIKNTRNALAHATQKENRVILVLLSLGAIAHIIEGLYKKCRNVEGTSYVTEADDVTLMQAELLGHCKLLEPNTISSLITDICNRNSEAFKDSCFTHLFAQNSFYKIQMLLCQCIVSHDVQPPALPKDKKYLTSLLLMTMHIPPQDRNSAESAFEWLFDTSKRDSKLLKCCGLNVLKCDLDASNSFIYSQIAIDQVSQELCSLFNQIIKDEIKYQTHKRTLASVMSESHDDFEVCFECGIETFGNETFWKERAAFFREEGQDNFSSLVKQVHEILSQKPVDRNQANKLLFLGSLRINLSVLQSLETNFSSKLDQYRQKCLSSQRFRVADANSSADPLGQAISKTDIGFWEKQIQELEKAGGVLEELLQLAVKVRNSLDAMNRAQRAFDKTCGNSMIQDIKSQMKSLFDTSNHSHSNLFKELKDVYDTTSDTNNTWHYLQSAIEDIANVSDSKKRFFSQCVPNPDSLFLFSSSVTQKKDPAAWDQLFRRCIDVLRPCFDLDLDCQITESLCRHFGCESFNIIAHFVTLASLSRHPDFESESWPYLVKDSGSDSGLRAAISASDVFVTRKDSVAFKALLGNVFSTPDSTHQQHLVLVVGQPGNGKSHFATQHLEEEQKYFESLPQLWPVYRHVFPARGREAVQNGLHMMGLALARLLGINPNAPREDVLGDVKNPYKDDKLRNFLLDQRYVIIADDIDEQGLKELLLHVPTSSKPCALILTSQFHQDVLMEDVRLSSLQITLFELDTFTPKESEELLKRVCKGCDIDALESWLTNVFSIDLGQSPLGVFIFSHWLKSMLVGPEPADAESILAEWENTLRDVSCQVSDHNRGFQATVRLSLKRISRFPDIHEHAKCFLKIMALTDPNDLNLWSLFDPELPYLFVPEYERCALPQLHLFEEYQNIKNRIDNVPLARSSACLLEELKFGRFCSLVEIVTRESSLMIVKRNSRGLRPMISMHQLIQQAIQEVLRDELIECHIVMLELIISRVFIYDKGIGISCVASYYSTIAFSALAILQNLQSQHDTESENELATRFQDTLTDAIIGRCEYEDQKTKSENQGVAWLLYRLDCPRESFKLTLQLLRMVKKLRLSQLQSLFEVQRKCCKDGPLFKHELSWQFDLCYLHCVCNHLESDSIEVEDIPTYVYPKNEDNFWYEFPGFDSESKKEPCLKTIFYIVRSSVEKLREVCKQKKEKKWLKKLPQLFMDFSKRLKDIKTPEEDFSADERHEALKLAERISKILRERVFSGENVHLRELKDKIKRRVEKYRLDDQVNQRSLYGRAYGCDAVAKSLFDLSKLQNGEVREKTLSDAIEWAYEAMLCAYATKANGHTNTIWRKEFLAQCLGASGKFYQESLYLFSSCLSQLLRDIKSNKSDQLQTWLDACRFWMILTLKEMQKTTSDPLNQYRDWLNSNFESCKKIQEDNDDLKLFQELRSFFVSEGPIQLYLDFNTPMPSEYVFQARDRPAELIEHLKVLAMLYMRDVQSGYFVRPQQPGLLKNIGCPLEQFVSEDEVCRLEVFDFLAKDEFFHEKEDEWFKRLQKDVSVNSTKKDETRWRKEIHSERKTGLGLFDEERQILQKHISNFKGKKSPKFCDDSMVRCIQIIQMLRKSSFEHRARFCSDMNELPNSAMIGILLQSSDIKSNQNRERALSIVESARNRNKLLNISAEEIFGPLLIICADLDYKYELHDIWLQCWTHSTKKDYICRHIGELEKRAYTTTETWNLLKTLIQKYQPNDAPLSEQSVTTKPQGYQASTARAGGGAFLGRGDSDQRGSSWGTGAQAGGGASYQEAKK